MTSDMNPIRRSMNFLHDTLNCIHCNRHNWLSSCLLLLWFHLAFEYADYDLHKWCELIEYSNNKQSIEIRNRRLSCSIQSESKSIPTYLKRIVFLFSSISDLELLITDTSINEELTINVWKYKTSSKNKSILK